MKSKWSAENPEKVEWEWLDGSEITQPGKMSYQVVDPLQYAPSCGDCPKWPVPTAKLITNTERR